VREWILVESGKRKVIKEHVGFCESALTRDSVSITPIFVRISRTEATGGSCPIAKEARHLTLRSLGSNSPRADLNSVKTSVFWRSKRIEKTSERSYKYRKSCNKCDGALIPLIRNSLCGRTSRFFFFIFFFFSFATHVAAFTIRCTAISKTPSSAEGV